MLLKLLIFSIYIVSWQIVNSLFLPLSLFLSLSLYIYIYMPYTCSGDGTVPYCSLSYAKVWERQCQQQGKEVTWRIACRLSVASAEFDYHGFKSVHILLLISNTFALVVIIKLCNPSTSGPPTHTHTHPLYMLNLPLYVSELFFICSSLHLISFASSFRILFRTFV